MRLTIEDASAALDLVPLWAAGDARVKDAAAALRLNTETALKARGRGDEAPAYLLHSVIVLADAVAWAFVRMNS